MPRTIASKYLKSCNEKGVYTYFLLFERESSEAYKELYIQLNITNILIMRIVQKQLVQPHKVL